MTHGIIGKTDLSYCRLKNFYEWNDFNIAAKPYQLQPFVVVGKK